MLPHRVINYDVVGVYMMMMMMKERNRGVKNGTALRGRKEER